MTMMMTMLMTMMTTIVMRTSDADGEDENGYDDENYKDDGDDADELTGGITGSSAFSLFAHCLIRLLPLPTSPTS